VRSGGSTSRRSRSNSSSVTEHAVLQDGGGAGAVADLGLLAPEKVVRQPPLEGLAEEAFLRLVLARELPTGGEEEP
jgi:hypothetical protein